jgi:hypothetical protein
MLKKHNFIIVSHGSSSTKTYYHKENNIPFTNRKHTIQIGHQTRPTAIGKVILGSKNRRQIVDMQHQPRPTVIEKQYFAQKNKDK